MLLNEKIIDSYESMPKRISSKSIYHENDCWDDSFQKSANEHYDIGNKYANAVLEKSLNKPVKQVIFKLKNHPSYSKNKSFKKAIDDLIVDLCTRVEIDFYSDRYYSNNGLLGYLKESTARATRSRYLYTNYYRQRFINEVKVIKCFDGWGDTGYIIRIYGIYYYTSEECYLYCVVRDSIKPKTILKRDYKFLVLNKFDIEHYELKTLNNFNKE